MSSISLFFFFENIFSFIFERHTWQRLSLSHVMALLALSTCFEHLSLLSRFQQVRYIILGSLFPSARHCFCYFPFIFQVYLLDWFSKLVAKLLFLCCPRGEMCADFEIVPKVVYCHLEARLSIVSHLFDVGHDSGDSFFANSIKRICFHVVGNSFQWNCDLQEIYISGHSKDQNTFLIYIWSLSTVPGS